MVLFSSYLVLLPMWNVCKSKQAGFLKELSYLQQEVHMKSKYHQKLHLNCEEIRCYAVLNSAALVEPWLS